MKDIEWTGTALEDMADLVLFGVGQRVQGLFAGFLDRECGVDGVGWSRLASTLGVRGRESASFSQ